MRAPRKVLLVICDDCDEVIGAQWGAGDERRTQDEEAEKMVRDHAESILYDDHKARVVRYAPAPAKAKKRGGR